VDNPAVESREWGPSSPSVAAVGLAGLLMALAYPPFNIGQMAWVALVPLLFALEDCRCGDLSAVALAKAEAFRRGYVAGLVFFAMTIWWIVHVTLPGTVGLRPPSCVES